MPQAAPGDLQAAESYFGGGAAPPSTTPGAPLQHSPQDLQSAEQYFANSGSPLLNMPPQSGSAMDTVWGSLKDAGGRILAKTGQGFTSDSAPLISPEDRQTMAKAGFINDYTTGHTNFLKSANEALIRNAIALARAPGAVLGAVQGFGEQVGQEIEGQTPNVAQKAAAYPFKALGEAAESVQGGALAELQGVAPHGEGVGAEATRTAPEVTDSEHLASATQGRALGALGEGEAGYFDAVEPTPENLQARAESAKEAGLEVPPPAPPADIHELARRVSAGDAWASGEPDALQQFDALAAERDAHRQTLTNMNAERQTSPEAIAAQNDVDTILGKVNGVEDRLTKAAQQRLDDARERLNVAQNRDTPEMAAVRSQLMDADFAMRDLAPTVSNLYRRAADMAPDLAEAENAPKEPTAEGGAPGKEVASPETEGTPQQVAPAAAQASAEAAEFKPASVTGEQKIGAPGEGSADDVRAGAETRGATSDTEVNTAVAGVKAPDARYGNLRAVEGTGDLKTRGLSESAEASAIQKGLTETFGDLPTYRELGNEGQFAKVVQHMDTDPKEAFDIAMGRKSPPKGTHPEAYYVGVLQRAEAAGDVDKALQLTNHSKLVTTATTMGQRIQLLSNLSKESPTARVMEVQAAREADLARRTGDVQAAKKAAVDEIRAEVKKTASKPDAWSVFIKSIQCGE